MIEKNQPTSTQRVITQNLVMAATEAETQTKVRKGSVRDLSTLINLVALYDEVFVLGRAIDFYQNSLHSDLVSFLANEQIIRTQPLDEKANERIAQIAQKHLAF